ncbi:MAG TPA: phytoene desaturase family protein [Novosphingobium sp.]|nr:phytoene desaturase family protein [Novosphingobium sp.]HQA17567.1 phytoene desaturase family protein [Novosphingobium sp.]
MASGKTNSNVAETTRTCVIGAGIGGLSLALRLQAAGVPTVLIEAREAPGGLIRSWQRDGFTFEAGPAAISDPAPLRELWSLTGEDLADAVQLIELEHDWRCSWPDGTQIDLPADPARLARIAPDDLPGYDDFVSWCESARIDGWERLARQPQGSALALIDALRPLLRHQGWRSPAGLAAQLVKQPHLRQALAFPVLLGGASPLTTSALNLIGQIPPAPGRGWWPQGGMNRLIAAMTRRFDRLGGTLRLHDPVVRLDSVGNRITEVECASGWRAPVTQVASNADVVHTYRDLLGTSQRGAEMGRKLANRQFSPSAFTVHFALEGSWPGIPHRSVLFGPRFEGFIEDVFTHGVLPQDLMIFLAHPSLSDPSLAPSGKSVFSATVLVANLGKLPLDWDAIGKLLEQRILAEIGRRLVPDIADRLIARFHTSPRDMALDFNAWLGAGWSLAATPGQSGPLRPHARDGKIANLYLVGAGTHPGAGLAAVMAGAKATADLMLEEHR